MDTIRNNGETWRPILKKFVVLDGVRLSTEFIICSVFFLGSLKWSTADVMQLLHNTLNSSEQDVVKQIQYDSHYAIYFTWILVSTGFAICIVELCLCRLLMEVCKPSCDASTASSDARLWKYVRIALCCSYLKGFLIILSLGPFVLKLLVITKIILTLVGLVIVEMFIREQDLIAAFPIDTNNNNDVMIEIMDELENIS